MTSTNEPLSSSTSDKVSVMLVDDSSVIRSALTRFISTDPDIEVVASVSNGELGVNSAKLKQPDVIILDIEMPVMDGLTAIPLIREVSPKSKIVMFSSLTEKGAQETIKAFSLGAVECVAKPSSHSLQGKDDFFRDMLTDLIKNLAGRSATLSSVSARPSRAKAESTTSTTTPIPPKAAPPPALEKNVPLYTGRPDILAIGSSTGGPQALFSVAESFLDFNIPIVITQHMPATFTKILAEHIEQKSGIPSVEGDEGMVLEKGKIYIAPGGKHMLFDKKVDGDIVIKLDDGEPVNFCKPAVEPMMDSLIKIYGQKILHVILTGMGNDGMKTAIKLANLGGPVIAQDEETSVVWGMPGAAAQAGACSRILPLNEIGPYVRKAVLG